MMRNYIGSDWQYYALWLLENTWATFLTNSVQNQLCLQNIQLPLVKVTKMYLFWVFIGLLYSFHFVVQK